MAIRYTLIPQYKLQEICSSKYGVCSRRCWCFCSAVSKWRPFFMFFNPVKAVNHLYLCLTVSMDSGSRVSGRNTALSLNCSRRENTMTAGCWAGPSEGTKHRAVQVLCKIYVPSWIMKLREMKGRRGKKRCIGKWAVLRIHHMPFPHNYVS